MMCIKEVLDKNFSIEDNKVLFKLYEKMKGLTSFVKEFYKEYKDIKKYFKN